MYFYLPLLWILLLAILFVWLFKDHWATHNIKSGFRRNSLIAVAIALMFSILGFWQLNDVAFERFETIRQNREGRARALSIPNPEQFRDVCLSLRTHLMGLPAEQRILKGDSPDLPMEIKAIHPISITGNEHYVRIKMTPDGGEIVAYPLDGMFAHVSSRRLAECLYYWPN